MANETKSSEGFAKHLFGSLVKTFVWAIGEVGMEDLKSDNAIDDVFAKLIFLGFLFLFVIVMMNLLNAVAIQDIQVFHSFFLFLFFGGCKRIITMRQFSILD